MAQQGLSGAGWAGYGIQAGTQIIAGFMQADMVRRQAAAQEEMANFNASLIEYDAWRTEAFGQTIIARMQAQQDQAKGAAKVQAAAAGVKLEGSLKELTDEQQLNAELNKFDIDNRATEQALGLRRQARQTRVQSQINSIYSNMQATSLQTAGLINATNIMTQATMTDQHLKKDYSMNTSPSGYSNRNLTNYKQYSNGVESWDIIMNPK